MFVGGQQALTFAEAIVRPLPEVRYQTDDDVFAFVIGEVVQYVHEAFGIARFLAGTEEWAVSFDCGKAFGTDYVPIILVGGHTLQNQLMEARGGFGTLIVKAQGIVEGRLIEVYYFFHDV